MDGFSYTDQRALIVKNLSLFFIIEDHVEEISLGVKLVGRGARTNYY